MSRACRHSLTTVVSCDEQDNLDTIRAAFEIELKEQYAKTVKSALSIESDEEMTKEQKSTVVKSVSKKLGGVLDHIRVVKSGGNYAYIHWAPDYQRNDEEEKAWKKVSVMSSTACAESDERLQR